MALRLKSILEARQVRLKDYAQMLGMSEKTLYNKLLGDTEFSYGEFQKLKALLPEYNIDYLLGVDEPAERR